MHSGISKSMTNKNYYYLVMQQPVYEDAPDVFNPSVVMTNEPCISENYNDKTVNPTTSKCVADNNTSFGSAIITTIVILLMAKGVSTIVDTR